MLVSVVMEELGARVSVRKRGEREEERRERGGGGGGRGAKT